MYNVDDPNVSPSEIDDITPEEGQILVSFTLVPNWEALAFPKDYSLGRRYFNEERKLPIKPSKFSSFKNIRGIPPYFYNMLLDFLANIMQFRVYTFILTCCAALFYWTEIIQVVARQNGETEVFLS